MLGQFIEFLAEYNVVGMAVGLLIAVKVGDLVKGIVDDLVTPLIFARIFKKLGIEKLEDLSWNGVLYGKVISRLIDFLITAFFVFLVVKYFGITKQ